jgi:hypothetical protein
MRMLMTGIALALAATTMAQAKDNVLTPEEKADGWILLFDGKTLDGWMNTRERPSNTPPQDGALNPRRCGGYLLIHEDTWEDFILKVDVKCPPDANSGIFVRQMPLKPPRGHQVWEYGIEIAIQSGPETPKHVQGAIYDMVAPSEDVAKPVGEWDHFEITCDGPMVKVNLNGTDICEMNMDDYTEPFKGPNGEEHKFPTIWANHPHRGYIGFQDHGDDTWYKNIKIKPLNGKGPE